LQRVNYVIRSQFKKSERVSVSVVVSSAACVLPHQKASPRGVGAFDRNRSNNSRLRDPSDQTESYRRADNRLP